MPATPTATPVAPPTAALAAPTDALPGLGLFSASPASLRFLPAATLRVRPGVGDLADIHPALVSADTAWAALPPGVPIRNTTLALPGAAPGSRARTAATVEHALSACAGLHLWGVTLALEGGPELPILDGSALPFLHALRPHLAPAAAVTPITLSEPLEVRAGDAFIRAEPFDSIDYTYSLDYGPASPLPPQHAAWRGDPDDYAINIAPARTFSLRAEAHAARAAGLFTHLSPRDMLVIADDGSPIDNAWRLPDEPARHKLLDLIGDLALLGRPLHARVHAHRAGHALTHRLCALVLAKSRAE